MTAGAALIGRDHHQAGILSLLGRERLVTITGAGGVGKSALARAVAARYDPGACLVDLDTVPAAAGPRHQLDPPWGGYPPPRLLVLDTCDHMIDACVDLVERLLHGFPDLRVLVTGREVMGIPGEHVVAAMPLYEHDVPTLFRRRSGGLPHEPDVLARLEGLPLAIEIAAEHLLTPERLAGMLDDGSFYDLPAGPSHPARHTTMRAAAAWSHDQCQPLDTVVWERLAAFGSSFGLDDAEEALRGCRPADASEAVARLVERSILLVDSAAPDGRWYRMPSYLRAFTK
ncbi:hypothetical protein OIE66_19750 [Nonomuraea sp. NBC_01738]|uniref:hypothetical protein n=1 Tax=Nonomuraea sp. NBC_01738 TaxID=2976003 RepID=UPI002E0E8B37|nr:hypothetical protein OIE66_19750 [Nonomuraea sp. NBC_01738]